MRVCGQEIWIDDGDIKIQIVLFHLVREMRCCFMPSHPRNTTLLPSVNTLIAREMFRGAKYTHHTFTPIIKHLITTTANKHQNKMFLFYLAPKIRYMWQNVHSITH